LVPFPIDEITTLKPFVHKNEKRIMFFFLLIFWKEKFEGTFFIFIKKLKQFFLNFGWNLAWKIFLKIEFNTFIFNISF
jgi:hypothetical protein